VVSGTLRFATSHHIGLHRLPPALKQFVRRYPQVRLEIRFMDSEQACHAVELGDLELAIVTLPPSPTPVLQVDTVWDDPLTVVVAADHPLAVGPPPTLGELAALPAVLPAPNTYTRQIPEQAFARLRLNLNVALSINYLETIKMLVSVGIGWGVLPVSMVDRQTPALSFPDLDLKRRLGAVCHRDRTLSNAARTLHDMLLRASP
jgi:DNA-binding transcriptional LysR family regulator